MKKAIYLLLAFVLLLALAGCGSTTAPRYRSGGSILRDGYHDGVTRDGARIEGSEAAPYEELPDRGTNYHAGRIEGNGEITRNRGTARDNGVIGKSLPRTNGNLRNNRMLNPYSSWDDGNMLSNHAIDTDGTII